MEFLTKHARKINVFAGMDGFVDEIVHVVDKREDFANFTRIETIADFGTRIMGAAGLSANVELVPVKTKLGGNGPIFCNALNSLGASVVYAGSLGKPNIHPIFREFAEQCEVYSLCEPGLTDALEFSDGKLMFGKHKSLAEVNWQSLKQAMGGTAVIAEKIANAELLAMTNWTMLPNMNSIWEGIINEVFPLLPEREVRPIAFFDLADPEKREKQDILSALRLIAQFEGKFRTILGLNEKESYQIAKVVGANIVRLKNTETTRSQLNELLGAIYPKLNIHCLVVHPVKCAAAQTKDGFFYTDGPYCEKPLLTTGAGDNFNAGFCYAQTIGLDPQSSLIAGVSTSGWYVRNAASPNLADLRMFMEDVK